MKPLRISLFGKFHVEYDEDVLTGCEPCKVQELFCYLLLNRDRYHARETLASVLWGDHCTTAQSKKYLRKALWQLHAALNARPGLGDGDLLHADPDWIRLNSIRELWLDVAVFEEIYVSVREVQGRNLDDDSRRALAGAVQLYKGDLLEGWYQDWCLCERERYQQIYLMMLDKLMGYCETHHEYEMGLAYGERILRCDRARERTHQRIMRLYYLAGDRTAALHQYERCVAVLKEELDIRPARGTLRLYEEMCEDRLDRPATPPDPAVFVPEARKPTLSEVLSCLIQLQAGLADVQEQVWRAIRAAKFVQEDEGSTRLHQSLEEQSK